jgi:osmotically-inducible protein OsmY
VRQHFGRSQTGLSALLTAPRSGHHGGMTQTTRRTDEEVRNAVIDELRWLSSVDASHIAVAVDGGCVTLSGEVGTYPETLLAAKAALHVRGITAVAQEVTVRGPWAAATDSDIGRQAAEALERAVNVPNTVKASVHEHTVTLSGQVTWQYEREAACRAVNYIEGVRSVLNLMTIRPGAVASGIKSDIIAALVRNAQFEGRSLTVTADTRGVITIGGIVRSSTERRQAELVCWSAPGVTHVVNELRIES